MFVRAVQEATVPRWERRLVEAHRGSQPARQDQAKRILHRYQRAHAARVPPSPSHWVFFSCFVQVFSLPLRGSLYVLGFSWFVRTELNKQCRILFYVWSGYVFV